MMKILPYHRGILTWIVGFTSDNVHLSRVIDSIPEFVSQACFWTVDSTPNKISDALILACASENSFLLDQTEIVFIERMNLSIFASVREITKSTPPMPWGTSLSHCPTCQTNLYLSSHNLSSSKCDIKCSQCGSEGFSVIPPGYRIVNLDHHPLKNPGRYSIGPFPRPFAINTVEWIKTKTKPQLELESTHDEQDLILWKSSVQDSPPWQTTWRFGVQELYICLEPKISRIVLDDQAFMELAFFDFVCSFWNVFPSAAKEVMSTMPELENTVKYHRLLHSKVGKFLLKSIEGKQKGSIPLLWPWLCRTLCFFDHNPSSREAFDSIQCPSVFFVSSK